MRLKNESQNKEVRTRLGRKLELLAFLVQPVIVLVYLLYSVSQRFRSLCAMFGVGDI